MKKLLTLFAATLFASSAFSSSNLVNITGYDLTNSEPNGTIGLNHTYTGDITSSNFGFSYDYTNGTGTLTDGLIQNPNAGHMLLGGFTSITLFLDDDYYIDDISFFSAQERGSRQFFNFLHFATINGVPMTSNSFGLPADQTFSGNNLFDLSGSSLENVATNQITFTELYPPSLGTDGYFTLSEIQVRGTLVSAIPEPSTYALMLGGLGLVGFMAVRRRRKLV
ncbi:hypothetical protein MNBD_GAMMA04-1356 [hydrothermal vent metagenome]|uniref:Ice-binding protein C-terminal domain-containing protein n=1 Tax=hydrothermal vent metagenome TaxID=652676 RepID=A0A3B0W1K7_9ZZZZ